MKNFLNKGIVLILITALILSLSSCGIPNYSPINCVGSSYSTENYSTDATYDYTKSYITVTGDVVTDETLSAEVLSSQYPRICFFYTIAPSGASYLSNLTTVFNNRYKTNTCLQNYSLASDRRFLSTTVSSTDSTTVYLYQFTLDQNNSDNKVSFIYGTDAFTRTSSSLYSYVNFNLDSSTKNLQMIINDPSTTDDPVVYELNRFNQKAFTTDTSLDGEAFSGNEVPAEYADQGQLTLYIYYSVEVGFSSYTNFQHTSLQLFKTISL